MARESTPWNVVVVVADTFRTAYLGAYGNEWIHTPNLDRFARESVRFTNAHPECSAHHSDAAHAAQWTPRVPVQRLRPGALGQCLSARMAAHVA